MNRRRPRTAVRRGRSRTVALAGVVLLAGVVAGVVLVARPGRPDPDADRGAVLAYVAAVEPLARQGGRVVVDGVQVGVRDLATADRPDPDTARMADGWRTELTSVRGRWSALTPPPRLVVAHRAFLAALDGYLASVDAVQQAARVTGPARQRLLDEAARHGRRADDEYDAASRAVRERLEALGEQPPSWLPAN